MKVAVTLIGWLAVASLGGWLVWWAVTRSEGASNASSTIALGSVLVLTWAVGTVLVWQRPWFATLTLATAAVLPLTPEHALPLPSLLVAVSAGLAVWSWLAGMASWLMERKRPLAEPDDQPVTVEEQPIASKSRPVPLQACVICQGPTQTTICAACGEALGPLAETWQQGGTKMPVTTGR